MEISDHKFLQVNRACSVCDHSFSKVFGYTISIANVRNPSFFFFLCLRIFFKVKKCSGLLLRKRTAFDRICSKDARNNDFLVKSSSDVRQDGNTAESLLSVIYSI